MATTPQGWIGAAGVRRGEDVGERLESYHAYGERVRRDLEADLERDGGGGGGGGVYQEDVFFMLLAYGHEGWMGHWDDRT